METHSNDSSSQHLDPVAALQVARDAQTRMAARVRSAWWLHVLRGLAIAATVFGLGGRPDGAAWLAPAGVIAFILLARWRTRVAGISRANPERWRFLALGAPWSIVLLVIAAAAMAFVVVVHDAPLWQFGVAAGVTAVATVVLGPLADRSARRRMAGDAVGGTVSGPVGGTGR